MTVGLQIKRMSVIYRFLFRFLLIEGTKLVASVVIYVLKKKRIVDGSINVHKIFLPVYAKLDVRAQVNYIITNYSFTATKELAVDYRGWNETKVHP